MKKAILLAIMTASLAAPAFAQMKPSAPEEWRNYRYNEARPQCRTTIADVAVEYDILYTKTDEGVDAMADVVLLGFVAQGYREGRTPLSSLPVGHPVKIRSTFGTIYNGVVATHKDGRTYFATDQAFMGEWWRDDMLGLFVFLTDDVSNRGDQLIMTTGDVEPNRIKLSRSLTCAQEHVD